MSEDHLSAGLVILLVIETVIAMAIFRVCFWWWHRVGLYG